MAEVLRTAPARLSGPASYGRGRTWRPWGSSAPSQPPRVVSALAQDDVHAPAVTATVPLDADAIDDMLDALEQNRAIARTVVVS